MAFKPKIYEVLYLQTVLRITITILDIIHRPVFYLKHGVSETGFFLRLQVEPTQSVSASVSGLALSIRSNYAGCTWRPSSQTYR
jgi:hypothetical protein